MLERAAEGQTNAEVAAALGVTTHAVKFHLSSIFRKLRVKNRTEATSAYWRQAGGQARGPDTGLMDFGLFAGVLWRSRLLVLAGLLIACAAAVFAMARVEINGHPRLVVPRSCGLPEHSSDAGDPARIPRGPQRLQHDPDHVALGSRRQSDLCRPKPIHGARRPSTRSSSWATSSPSVCSAVSSHRSTRASSRRRWLPRAATAPCCRSSRSPVSLRHQSRQWRSPTEPRRRSPSISPSAKRRPASPSQTESSSIGFAGPLRPSVYLPRKKTRAIFAFALILMLTVAAVFMREKARNRRAAAERQRRPGVEQLLNQPNGAIGFAQARLAARLKAGQHGSGSNR